MIVQASFVPSSSNQPQKKRGKPPKSASQTTVKQNQPQQVYKDVIPNGFGIYIQESSTAMPTLLNNSQSTQKSQVTQCSRDHTRSKSNTAARPTRKTLGVKRKLIKK